MKSIQEKEVFSSSRNTPSSRDTIRIHPISSLKGKIYSSPSKSYSHRAFILSLLASSPSLIVNPLMEGDVAVTIRFCEALGAIIAPLSKVPFFMEDARNDIKKEDLAEEKSIQPDGKEDLSEDDDIFYIDPQSLGCVFGPEIPNHISQILKEGVEVIYVSPPLDFPFHPPPSPINGENSGTTIRIMSALAPLCKTPLTLYGTFFDKERPISPLLEALSSLDVKYEFFTLPKEYGHENDSSQEIVPFSVGNHRKKKRKAIRIYSPEGVPYASDIFIRGDISSQFITGLLFLTPKLRARKERRESRIILTTPAKSYPYLKITEKTLRAFGITFSSSFDETHEGFYQIPAEQRIKGTIFYVPGDFSSAAFIMAAAALGDEKTEVSISPLDMDDPQGDKEFFFILKKMGANISYSEEKREITIKGGSELKGIQVDCSNIPDLFPILTVIGCFAQGKFEIYNAKHVRIKETDRISIMVRELRKMGATIEEKEDGIIINDVQKLHGATLDHENDHRIAMALSIAALYASSPSLITYKKIVADSYPNFFKDLIKLGAKIYEERS